LFFDVRQRHHIRSLPAAGWATAESPQTTHADIHILTQARGRKRFPVFFDEPKPHGFWLAKNCVDFLRNSRPLWHGRQYKSHGHGTALEV
jgi:hypothetical protein